MTIAAATLISYIHELVQFSAIIQRERSKREMKYRAFSLNNYLSIPQIEKLPDEIRKNIEVVSSSDRVHFQRRIQ